MEILVPLLVLQTNVKVISGVIIQVVLVEIAAQAIAREVVVV